MNMQHFQAFVWLRWRLRVNQLKKGGLGNVIVLGIMAAALVISSVGLFIGGFSVGCFALKSVSPAVLMYVWDGIVVGFLFFWMIGLMADLQRTDSLSLDKFLHFPVSLKSVFLINYLSSLVGLTTIIFVPLMLGMWLGLVASRGVSMLLLLPAMAAFIFAVTAITYQFQGWLASLMGNPRKRRTVIGLVTISFVLLAQTPNLFNIIRPFGKADEIRTKARTEKINKLTEELSSKAITLQQNQERMQQIEAETQAEREAENKKLAEDVERYAGYANMTLPPGWLPLGVRGLATGDVLVSLAGTLAFGLIGSLSLWRAYRTTLRLYTGFFTTGTAPAAKETSVRKEGEKFDSSKVRLVEYQISWLPEQAAGVAFGSFRSLLRAPEAKMILVLPFIFILIFGGIFMAQGPSIPGYVRPLAAFGANAMMLFSLMQLIANQFGYDRSGFRAFVLCPVPRNEILLGKNLAMLPFALGFCFLANIALEILMPMRIDHFISGILHFLPMFLGMCLLGNMLSIFAPIAVAQGSMKASDVKFMPVLMHMGSMMILPIIYLPAILPAGIEIALDQSGLLPGIPVAIWLDVLVAVGSVYAYRRLLDWQGGILQDREKRILEVVTSKGE